MGILKSITGTVRVELTSADLPSAFGAVSAAGIPFFDTEAKGELSSAFSIFRDDFRRLRDLCGRRGESLRILNRGGVYWTAKGMLKRPVLILGMLFFLTAVLCLPARIFFFQVEGNHTVPDNRILEAAQNAGIRFGASRREVRSERVKNALLEAVPELQWAGVNTYGCVAKISVRERSVTEQSRTESGYGNIIAIRDGVILNCTATEGNLLCAPGQAVREGQVLVSGYMDLGICIRAVQAEGEVYAETIRHQDAILPAEYEKRGGRTVEKKKISLLIGKNRVNLRKDSGIWDTTCGTMYQEYDITLPGGFRLPLALVIETFTFQEKSVVQMPQEEAEAILTDFSAGYLRGQMVAGSIRASEYLVEPEAGRYNLAGEYVCVEMIGKMQREQIGESNGENR